MKIYFAGSIRGGRDEEENYLKIIKHLAKYGDVLTEHVGLKDIEKNEQNRNMPSVRIDVVNVCGIIITKDLHWKVEESKWTMA